MTKDGANVNGWRRAAILPYTHCDQCGAPAPYFHLERGRRCAEHAPTGVVEGLRPKDAAQR